MSTGTEHDKDAARDRENARKLLMSAADTTWRMFVPPLILVPAGIFVDLKLHTMPWITIVAAVAGLVVAVMLVGRQLKGGDK